MTLTPDEIHELRRAELRSVRKQEIIGGLYAAGFIAARIILGFAWLTGLALAVLIMLLVWESVAVQIARMDADALVAFSETRKRALRHFHLGS